MVWVYWLFDGANLSMHSHIEVIAEVALSCGRSLKSECLEWDACWRYFASADSICSRILSFAVICPPLVAWSGSAAFPLPSHQAITLQRVVEFGLSVTIRSIRPERSFGDCPPRDVIQWKGWRFPGDRRCAGGGWRLRGRCARWRWSAGRWPAPQVLAQNYRLPAHNRRSQWSGASLFPVPCLLTSKEGTPTPLFICSAPCR